MLGNHLEEINEIVRVLSHESGILPYQEIDYDIERRRTSQHASGRHSAVAESHQTRPRSATMPGSGLFRTIPGEFDFRAVGGSLVNILPA
jgi:hypothetical protein